MEIIPKLSYAWQELQKSIQTEIYSVMPKLSSPAIINLHVNGNLSLACILGQRSKERFQMWTEPDFTISIKNIHFIFKLTINSERFGLEGVAMVGWYSEIEIMNLGKFTISFHFCLDGHSCSEDFIIITIICEIRSHQNLLFHEWPKKTFSSVISTAGVLIVVRNSQSGNPESIHSQQFAQKPHNAI